MKQHYWIAGLLGLFILITLEAATAAPMDPTAAALSGYDSTTLNTSYDELLDALWNETNTTRTVGSTLAVPWYSADNVCKVTDLKSGGDCNIPVVDHTQYCMVTDEFSVVMQMLAMGNNETRYEQAFQTVLASSSTYGQLPGWKILVNETAGTMTGCHADLNGNCDTASDADARIISSLYIAGANGAFSTTAQDKYLSLAVNLSEDMVDFEFVYDCLTGKSGYGSICWWPAGGSVVAAGGMASGDFMYSGYSGDIATAMAYACGYTNNDTYCEIYRNVTLAYLQAAYPAGQTISGDPFRVPPGKSYKWVNTSGVPGAECTNTCSPVQWDAVDAPRATSLGHAWYVAESYGISHASPFETYLANWISEHGHDSNSSFVYQYLNNGDGAHSAQSGYFAQGLQSMLNFGGATGYLNETILSGIDHYDTATNTWDWSACYGVYGQSQAVSSFGWALGRDEGVYNTFTNADVNYTGSISGNTLTPTCTIDGGVVVTHSPFRLDLGCSEISCIAGSGYNAFTHNMCWDGVNVNYTSYTITETSSGLTFDAATTGAIYDEWGSYGYYNWSGSSYSNTSATFCNGGGSCYVTIEFNTGGTGEQHFQWNNDDTGTLSDTLHIIDSMDSQFTVQTTGITNNPINDVRVRVSMLNDSAAGTQDYLLIGQRYTDEEAKATFYTSQPDYLLIHATADGYNNFTTVIEVDEFINYSREDPFTIVMTAGVSSFWVEDMVYPIGGFWEGDDNLSLCIYSVDGGVYQYWTSYRTSPQLLIVPETGEACAYLIADDEYDLEDFNISVLSPITGLTLTRQVTYRGSPTNIFAEFGSLSFNVLMAGLFILLIFISILIGAYVNPQTGTAGFHTFMLGVIPLSFIGGLTTSYFFIPAIISVIYYGFNILFKNQEAL